MISFTLKIRNSLRSLTNYLIQTQHTMLKTFLVAALAVLTIVSCSKDKDDKNDTPIKNFSAKIDGVKKDFNFSVAAQLNGTSAQTGYLLFINGNAGTTSNPLPNFYVEINVDAPIEAKTYQTIQSQSKWEADANYWLDGSTVYEVHDHDFSITITSITSTEVRGTFSGTLEDSSTGQVINITEGTFSAPIVP